MIIKNPNSDIALNSLKASLRTLRRVAENDIKNCRNMLTIIYMSSYIISYTGIKKSEILDTINDILKRVPDRLICVLRTNDASIFRGYYRKIQEISIDEIMKTGCYVKMFDMNMYVNHAKFLIGYHFCFSSNEFYHVKYYGSTNFTLAGLSYTIDKKSNLIRGNYEEFYSSNVKYLPLKDLFSNTLSKSARDVAYYLHDIYSIVKDINGLYLDKKFLENHINNNVKTFYELINNIEKILKGTTRIDLFRSYLESQLLFLQTLSFIESLPGKILTSEIIKRAIEKIEPPDILGIELSFMNNEEIARLIDLIGLSDKELYEGSLKYLNETRSMLENVLKSYNIKNIERYYNNAERMFAQHIERYGDAYLKILKDTYDKIGKPKL
jgi:hypothetical protein